MREKVFLISDIVTMIKPFAEKYNIKEIYIFGSYARNEATTDSDIDFLVYGGENFKLTNIFALAEDLRAVFQKNIDMFEIHEINQDSEFFKTIISERVKVA